MRIGFIATGNGSALFSAAKIAHSLNPELKFYGFSDRECKAFSKMSSFCSDTRLFNSPNNSLISAHALNFFSEQSCERIFLLYSRLVTEELHKNLSCYNIHPSILPNFKGLNAVQNAFNSKSRELGVTLHRVDSSIDSGKIVSLVSTRPSIQNINYWFSMSYLMKVMLLASSILTPESELGQSFSLTCQQEKVLFFDRYLPEKFFFTDTQISHELTNKFTSIARDSHCSSYHPLLPSFS